MRDVVCEWKRFFLFDIKFFVVEKINFILYLFGNFLFVGGNKDRGF